jgi:hypothetical protein
MGISYVYLKDLLRDRLQQAYPLVLYVLWEYYVLLVHVNGNENENENENENVNENEDDYGDDCDEILKLKLSMLEPEVLEIRFLYYHCNLPGVESAGGGGRD